MKHGNYATYNNHKCRCSACRNAWRLKCLEFNAARKKRGQCRSCMEPICPRSVTFCKKHLEANRMRYWLHDKQVREEGRC